MYKLGSFGAEELLIGSLSGDAGVWKPNVIV